MTLPFLRAAAALAAALLVSACTGERKDAAQDTGQQAATAQAAKGDSMGGMPGMQGMSGMSGTMMTEMQAHMRTMETAGADSLKAMLPMHRQMAANMISEFNREMQGMNMKGDAQWTATMDSLRQDLVRMPDMGAAELKGFMPAHHARMMRLMESHQSMMKNMKM